MVARGVGSLHEELAGCVGKVGGGGRGGAGIPDADTVRTQVDAAYVGAGGYLEGGWAKHDLGRVVV